MLGKPSPHLSPHAGDAGGNGIGWCTEDNHSHNKAQTQPKPWLHNSHPPHTLSYRINRRDIPTAKHNTVYPRVCYLTHKISCVQSKLNFKGRARKIAMSLSKEINRCKVTYTWVQELPHRGLI